MEKRIDKKQRLLDDNKAKAAKDKDVTALLLAIKKIPFLSENERRTGRKGRKDQGNLYVSESDYKNFFP